MTCASGPDLFDDARTTLFTKASEIIQRKLRNHGVDPQALDEHCEPEARKRNWTCGLLANVSYRPLLSSCFPGKRKRRGMSAISANIILTTILAEYMPRKLLSIKSTAGLLDRFAGVLQWLSVDSFKTLKLWDRYPLRKPC